jgi:hypothetical protein
MTANTGGLSLPFTIGAHRIARARRPHALATGALSVGFGIYLAVQTGVVSGP